MAQKHRTVIRDSSRVPLCLENEPPVATRRINQCQSCPGEREPNVGSPTVEKPYLLPQLSCAYLTATKRNEPRGLCRSALYGRRQPTACLSAWLPVDRQSSSDIPSTLGTSLADSSARPLWEKKGEHVEYVPSASSFLTWSPLDEQAGSRSG